uniref:FCH domain-containing protein n=1 Tax=Echinostoma caproni TaxID=27848 RepID=A0A183B9C7_9TREM
LARASQQAFTATTQLATSLRSAVLAEWKEIAAYAQAVRGVFNARDNLEKRYFDTVEELRNETDNTEKRSESRFSVLAKSYLPWRQRSPSEFLFRFCNMPSSCL